ncbi:MAG TPA: DUF423 domain-containing protein [Gammaproteobacteria bacterium]
MSSIAKLFVALASASLLVATMLGAYASHGMRSADAAAVDAVRTAVAFQFHHGLALLAVALLRDRLGGRAVDAAGWLFFAGTVGFCGAIYASRLAGWSAAGQAAPLGGVTLMAGWAALIVAAIVHRAARRVPEPPPQGAPPPS